MPKSSTWVVKLGGSMLESRVVGAWLDACAGAGEAVRCVVVAGGGRGADAVRAAQRTHGLTAAQAHARAIGAMAANARTLAAAAPGLAVFSALDGALPPGDGIWLPLPPYDGLALPASWAVTSDSIALRVAERVGATAVVLVKSAPPARLAVTSAARLAADGVVDAHLPVMLGAGRVPVRLLHRDAHAAFVRARRRGRVCGTLIGP